MTTSLELVDSHDDESVKTAVARRLRQELAGKPRRISQRVIAEAVGMTQQQLSGRLIGKIEFGVEELTRVCDATSIDLVYVMTGIRKNPRHPGGDDGGQGVRPKGFEPLTSWSVTDEEPTCNVTPLRPTPFSSPEPRRIAA